MMKPNNPKEKSFKEKETERLKYILNDLKTNGLKSYEPHKDLILKMAIKKIEEEIEELK